MNQSLKCMLFYVAIGLVLATPLQAATVYWTGANGDLFENPLKWTPNLPVAADVPVICNGTTAELSTPYSPVLGALYLGYTDGGTNFGNGSLNISGAGDFANTGDVYLGYDGYNGTLGMTGGTINSGGILYVGDSSTETSPAGTGTYTQSGGTANFTGAVRIGYNVSSGNVLVSGGTFTTLSGYAIGYSAQAPVGSNSVQTGGTMNVGDSFYVGLAKASTATMTGGVLNYTANPNTYGGSLYIGRSAAAGTSTFNFEGGVINKVKGNGSVLIGESGSQGILNMSGSAVMNTAGSTITLGTLGAAASSGIVNMGGDAIWNITNSSMPVGYGLKNTTTVAPGLGEGIIELSGQAAINLRGTAVSLGVHRSTQGLVKLNGESSFLMYGNRFIIGENGYAAPDATSTQSIGKFTLTGQARADISTEYIRVGNNLYASGEVNIGTLGSTTDNPTLINKVGRNYISAAGATGVWNQNAGLTLSTGGVLLASAINATATGSATPNASGTLNLNGGVFAANVIFTEASFDKTGYQAPATINFNGGTLRAVWNNSNWIANGGNANMNLFVKEGGAVIDTNSYTVSIQQRLQSDAVSLGGGLRKINDGVLRLTAESTYTGNTVIEGGTLRFIDSATSASSGITVKSGATLGGKTFSALPAVTLEAGGILAPGDGFIVDEGLVTSTYGTLPVASLSLGNDSRLIFRKGIGTAESFDYLRVGAVPSVAGTAIVDFSINSFDAIYYTGGLAPVMEWPTTPGETALVTANPATSKLKPAVDTFGTTAMSLAYDTVTYPGTSSINVVFTDTSTSNHWQGASGGNWSNPANWLGAIPNAADARAFLLNQSSETAINLDTNVTVNSLVMQSFSPYTLSSTSAKTLTLGTADDAASVSAESQISVLSGSHVVNVPVVLNRDTRMNIYDSAGSNGYSLTLGNVVSGSGGISLYGGGKLKLDHTANTYTGPTVMHGGTTESLSYKGGTLEVKNLADGGNSSLGAWSADCLDPAHLVLNGTFRYTGSTPVVTQRGITIAGETYFETEQNITLSGRINGSGMGVFYKTGAGTLTFDYQGNQTLNHTDVRLVAGNMIFNGGDASIYKLESDAGANSAWLVVGDNATTSSTTMEIQSGTIEIMGAVHMSRGDLSGSTHTLRLTGNAKIDAMHFNMGWSNYSPQVPLSTNPVLEMSGNSQLLVRTTTYLGDYNGTNATVNLSGNAKIESIDFLRIANGDGSIANVTLSDDSQIVVNTGHFNCGTEGQATVTFKDRSKFVGHSNAMDFNVGVENNSNSTLNIQNSATLDIGRLYLGRWGNGTGTVDQSGGTVRSINKDSQIWRIGGDTLYDGTTVTRDGSQAKGIYNLSGGSVDTIFDRVQVGASGTGEFNQTGGDLRIGGRTWVGYDATARGTINLSNGNAQFTEYLVVGFSGLGVVNQTGGTSTVINRTYWGDAANSSGYYNLSGGTANLNGAYNYIGNGGYGLFEMTGGTMNLAAGARLTLGSKAGSYGVVNFNGGAVIMAGSGEVSTTLSEAGTGVMNISGTADIQNLYRVYVGYGAGTRGILNLGSPNNAATTDGALAVKMLEERVATDVVGTVNFHGGTLKAARDNNPTWVKNLDMYVYGDGAVIDTAGFDMGITTSSLLAPTGKGVTSIAINSADNGSDYVSPPLVKIEGGSGSGATAVASIDAEGHISGITITNPGVNYADGDVLTFTFLGGGGIAPTVSPTYTFADNVSGGLTKLGLGTLTLSGGQTYTGDTVVNAGTLTFTTALATPAAEVYVAADSVLNATSIVADTLTIGGAPMVSASAAAVPEPGTFALLALAGLALVGAYIRRK